MPHDPNYYETLGVDRSASTGDIKRAYRKLAKQFHPDHNPGDPSAEERFKRVQRAYQVLSHPERRTQYDQFGTAGVGDWSTNPHGQRVYQWGGNSGINIDDLEDLMSAFGADGKPASIFDNLFGRGQTRRGAPKPRRGADEERSVSLNFEQAIHGCTITVNLRSRVNGRSESLDVKVPPGVEEGQRIRLRGKGQPGINGAPAGDMFLVMSIRPHAFFTRRGTDIYLDVPVSVSEAVLGGKLDVPTLDGRVTVTLPPGTRSGAKLRLTGKGLANEPGGGRGDQFVIVQVVVPDELTEEQRRCFERLGEIDQTDPRAQRGWWDA